MVTPLAAKGLWGFTLSYGFIDNSSRGDKPQVTDWAGEGTEEETLTLSRIGWRIIIFNCFYLFVKVEGNEGGLYI
jgi:hypothetical protein